MIIIDSKNKPCNEFERYQNVDPQGSNDERKPSYVSTGSPLKVSLPSQETDVSVSGQRDRIRLFRNAQEDDFDRRSCAKAEINRQSTQ